MRLLLLLWVFVLLNIWIVIVVDIVLLLISLLLNHHSSTSVNYWSTTLDLLMVSVNKNAHHARTPICYFLRKWLWRWQLFNLVEVKQLRHYTPYILLNVEYIAYFVFMEWGMLFWIPFSFLALLVQVTSIVQTHHYKVVRIAVHLLFEMSLLLVTHDST